MASDEQLIAVGWSGGKDSALALHRSVESYETYWSAWTYPLLGRPTRLWNMSRNDEAKLLESFPSDVVPFGENGDFHPFVWDGPPFSHPIPIERRDVVYRDERAYYCDLLEA